MYQMLNSRPTQWFTPTRGLLNNRDSVRATSATDERGAPIPGPGRLGMWRSYLYLVGWLTLRETYTVHVVDRDLGFTESIIDHRECPVSVVLRGVPGLESLPRRGDVRVSDVGEHCRGTICVVFDEACPKLVR